MRVVVPSLNFRVAGTVGEDRRLSRFEDVVVHLVSDGFTTVEALADLLGLPGKRTVMVISEMVSRGVLMFDVGTGRVFVPLPQKPGGGAAVARGWGTSSGYVEVREFELTLNRCTGAVGPARVLGTGRNQGNRSKGPEIYLSPESGLVELDAELEGDVRTAINAILRSEGLRLIDLDFDGAEITREGGLFATMTTGQKDGDERQVVIEFDPQHSLSASEQSQLEAAVRDVYLNETWLSTRWNALQTAQVSTVRQRPDVQSSASPATSPSATTGRHPRWGGLFRRLRDLRSWAPRS